MCVCNKVKAVVPTMCVCVHAHVEVVVCTVVVSVCYGGEGKGDNVACATAANGRQRGMWGAEQT